MILYQRKNAPIGAQKRLICLKQKGWSKSWVLVTSNRCPDHLSRQFLTTASTFPYCSKNSSAEHIHVLSTWLIITNTLTHIDNQSPTVTHIDKHTHLHTPIPQPNIFSLCQHDSPSQTNSLTYYHTHTHTHRHFHAHSDMYKKMWICSAEEFLELYGTVEALVRNCLLKWPGHLVEVAGTLIFDQSFCFKHISILCSDMIIFQLVPSISLLHQRFYVQKWGKFEPLYLSNESRFWKIKKCF